MLKTIFISSENKEYKFFIDQHCSKYFVHTNVYWYKTFCDCCDFCFPDNIEQLSKRHPEAANYITKYIKHIIFI